MFAETCSNCVGSAWKMRNADDDDERRPRRGNRTCAGRCRSSAQARADRDGGVRRVADQHLQDRGLRLPQNQRAEEQREGEEPGSLLPQLGGRRRPACSRRWAPRRRASSASATARTLGHEHADHRAGEEDDPLVDRAESGTSASTSWCSRRSRGRSCRRAAPPASSRRSEPEQEPDAVPHAVAVVAVVVDEHEVHAGGRSR